jgi:hypothetical protein
MIPREGREGKVTLEFIGWWSQLGGEFVFVPNVFPRGSSRIDFNEVLTMLFSFGLTFRGTS